MTTIKTNGHSLVVTIDGDEYANLARAADALNSASWTDDDNTPETVFREFVWSWARQNLTEPRELANDILDGIATGDPGSAYDAEDPEHKRRLAELEERFKEAGLL